MTVDLGEKPLFEWLQERHNLRAAHAQERLLARLTTQNERQLLRISPTSPVISLERTVWTDTRRPVEWAQIIAVASLYLFTYEYDIFEWNKEHKHDDRTQIGQPTPQRAPSSWNRKCFPWDVERRVSSPSFLLSLEVACHGRITKRKRTARLEGRSATLAQTRDD